MGIRYKQLSDFAGYRFGSDGSVWSRWVRHGHGWPKFGCFASIEGQWRRLRQHPRKDGYMHINLRRSGGGVARNLRVSHLILRAFGRPRPTPAHESMHLDDDPANNANRNLKWGTRQENANDCRRKGRMRNQHTGRLVSDADQRRHTLGSI